MLKKKRFFLFIISLFLFHSFYMVCIIRTLSRCRFNWKGRQSTNNHMDIAYIKIRRSFSQRSDDKGHCGHAISAPPISPSIFIDDIDKNLYKISFISLTLGKFRLNGNRNHDTVIDSLVEWWNGLVRLLVNIPCWSEFLVPKLMWPLLRNVGRRRDNTESWW